MASTGQAFSQAPWPMQFCRVYKVRFTIDQPEDLVSWLFRTRFYTGAAAEAPVVVDNRVKRCRLYQAGIGCLITCPDGDSFFPGF